MAKSKSKSKDEKQEIRHNRDTRIRIMKIYEWIQQGKARKEIIALGVAEYDLSDASIAKYYETANRWIIEEDEDKIDNIRQQRIESLRKDTKDAYTNYLTEQDPKLRAKWFEIYRDTKLKMDKYYKNELRVEEEPQKLNINISYEDAE